MYRVKVTWTFDLAVINGKWGQAKGATCFSLLSAGGFNEKTKVKDKSIRYSNLVLIKKLACVNERVQLSLGLSFYSLCSLLQVEIVYLAVWGDKQARPGPKFYWCLLFQLFSIPLLVSCILVFIATGVLGRNIYNKSNVRAIVGSLFSANLSQVAYTLYKMHWIFRKVLTLVAVELIFLHLTWSISPPFCLFLARESIVFSSSERQVL